MTGLAGLIYRRQMVSTVEQIGAPFAVRWRIRCSRCGDVTRPCERISTALVLSSEHADLHALKASERAA